MIDQITKDLLNRIETELKKDENKNKIKNDILEPIFSDLRDKIYPYISLLFVMHSINIILIVVILFFIVVKKKENK